MLPIKKRSHSWERRECDRQRIFPVIASTSSNVLQQNETSRKL
ncbi:hypothetical protein [Plectonema radiosum]|nr:hypothetical protein [Plectonema radiosum]